jgi:hypothetical protein
MSETVLVTVKVKIDVKEICNLVVSAFEGGSNYWLKSVVMKNEEAQKQFESPWYGDEKFWRPENPHCVVIAEFENFDKGPELITKELVWDDFTKGLQKMARKAPQHFCDVMDENADANTGDTYIQMVIFGKVIYG